MENPTRQDIADLLASIAPPGQLREEKRAIIAELDAQNSQGVRLEDDLEDYAEF